MKTILVVWPTYREDWVAIYQELSNDFDLVFLSGLIPDDSKPNYVAKFASTIYWSDFDSAQDVLQKIQPDGIVFMSVDTGLSMALNFNAKKIGIETFLLQHGIYTNYKDYRIRERLWKKATLSREVSVIKSNIGFSSAQFISNSLPAISKVWFPLIFIYTLLSKKVGPYWTSKHFPLSIKRVSRYLCLSPYNATIHLETDRISPQRITYVGSAELVKYLEKSENEIVEKYYLHIDQALAENSFGEETVTRDQVVAFYKKINAFSSSKGAKLYIKLHPESYQSDWLPKDENIVYLRKVFNFNDYIQSAEGCFGFYSTMIIPAIYWKPTILFKIYYSGLQEALKRDLNIRCLDFYDFDRIDFGDRSFEQTQDILVERYIQPHASIPLTKALI